MNVPVIEMDQDEAKAKLEAYHAQLRKKADAEYEAAAAGYEQLAKGRRLINLADAIQSGGLGADGRPKLAVAPAHHKEVQVSMFYDRVAYRSTIGRRLGAGLQFAIPGARWTTMNGFAMVPMIPADVRTRDDLSKCHILWEVVAWADHFKLMRPDRDPYLLRHISADLYAILAEWELTDLERAVMAQRRPAE